MTQRDRVLLALKAAGPKGVRSDTFIKNFMPRAAARVQELKDEGHDISSEREGKYVRWTLNVGVGADDAQGGGGFDHPHGLSVSTDSGVAASPLLPVPVEARARTIPNAYNCWEDAA